MRGTNILSLGIKELRGLLRDPVMLVLVVYSFTVAIHAAATALPEALERAPIAIVDEDRSPLSTRIVAAFGPPTFDPPALIDHAAMDARMDAGIDTFALNIPPGFQRDVLGGRDPAIQLNVDATRMSQAFTGSGYVQAIVNGAVAEFLRGTRSAPAEPVALNTRARFNQELNQSWFGGVMELINQVTLLSIILTGAALLREREHGTIEHLLVMPVRPVEIMIAKVWSMALVVLLSTAFSLIVVVRFLLGAPIEGSITLFLTGVAVHLFATTSMGIFLGTVARSMPQFALLAILILLPLEMLSGGMTPRESMPALVRWIMLAAPTTHFVMLAQAILYRGAGFSVVWPQFLALTGIGGVLFAYALARFRSAVGTMA